MEKLQDIEINKIETKENVRTEIGEVSELMRDIKQRGLLQPIGVTKAGKNYCLIYGHRRLSACKKLGWMTIPAIIQDNLLNKNFLTTNVAENIHRKDINPVELGRICYKLKNEERMNNGEMASALSIPKVRVATALKLYKNVPEKFRDTVTFANGSEDKQGKIASSTATAIANLRIARDKMLKIFERAKKQELTVGDIRIIGDLINAGMTPEKAIKQLENAKLISLKIIMNKQRMEELQEETGFHISAIVREIIKGRREPEPKLCW